MSGMRWRRWALVLGGFGVAIGMASSPGDENVAQSQSLSTYMVRWMASPSANWYYCFGQLGWHGAQGHPNQTAADIFADAQGPCGDWAWNYVFAMTYGATSGGSQYQLLGAARDMSTDTCSGAGVDVWQWNSAQSTFRRVGSERYLHVLFDGVGMKLYDIYLGPNWSWSFSQIGLGYEQYPDGACPTNHPHNHAQTCGYPSSYPLNSVRNSLPAADTAYPQHDLWYYLHRWDWDTAPSSDRPWVC